VPFYPRPSSSATHLTFSSSDIPAIDILNWLLCDGSTTASGNNKFSWASTNRLKPVRVAPPSHIALLSTVIVHPSFTTRCDDSNHLHVPAYAISYLRGLLRTVGPVNANFRAAFDFSKSSSSSFGRGSSNSIDNMNDDDSDHITGGFVESQLLWKNATDFWAVFGWACRCAAEHPQRWQYWRVWLDFVIEAMERDWDERLSKDIASGKTSKGKSAPAYPLLRESLLVTFLADLERQRKNIEREVLRALFAFCNDHSATHLYYKEVFKKETATIKSQNKRKRADAVVDLENDRFGDYFDDYDYDDYDDDDDDDDADGQDEISASASRPKKKGRKHKSETAISSFNLTDTVAESIPLRLRIFRLLSAAAYYISDVFMPVDELYEKFTDELRKLPLPVFRLFIQSHTSILPRMVQVTLLRVVANNLLPHNKPDPAEVDPNHGSCSDLTQLIMTECYLPFAAKFTNTEDNAKLSMTLESLMWYLFDQIEIKYSDELCNAVETGIRAREGRIPRRAGRMSAADKQAREALARSAENLRALLDVLAAAAKK